MSRVPYTEISMGKRFIMTLSTWYVDKYNKNYFQMQIKDVKFN